ncbi:MAG: hypothetical protein ACI35W_05390 [Anaeroplasmataceae bacterium]
MKKKIISVGFAVAVLLTLASCKETAVNTVVPYGSLSDSKVYANIGTTSQISEKKLYDLMKRDGYSKMLESLKLDLFKDIMENKDYFDYSKEEDRYKINSSLVSAIYGVSSYDSFKEMKNKDKTTAINKYVDNLFKNGTKKEDGTYFTVSDIEAITITEAKYEGESVFEATFPKELYKSYIYDIAMDKYAIANIKDPNSEYYYKNEYVKGEGKNSYYITDNDVRDYYYTTYKNYKDYQGIVIKFASEAQAIATMESVNGSTTIAPENALQTYLSIYNQRYVTRNHLSLDNYLDDDNVNLRITPDKNDFTSISSNLEDFFKDMENGEYLSTYYNIGGSYYLIYRISGSDVVEWENLDDAQKAPGTNEKTIYDKVLDILIKKKNLTSLKSKLESERYEEIAENGLVIYDPVYSYLYDQDREEYEINNKSSETLIYEFEYNSTKFSLSVDDFYPILEAQYGMDTAIDYLSNQYYLSLDKMVEKIDEDDVTTYRSNLNEEIKQFNKGKKDYNKNIGVETYLQLTYSMSNVDDIVSDYKASLVEAKALSYYGNHASSADNTLFDTNSTLFKNFETIYKEIYEKFFSATISHILIGIDEDGSGSYSDPDIYRANLASDELRNKFDETIINLANAIISEVNVLKVSKDIKDALTYIVTAYDNNYKIASLSYKEGREITWYDLKNEFPIALKAEDLGEINNSNASNYVSEFSVAARDLYNKVKDGTIKESDVEDKGVLQFSTDISTTEDLCKTVYGFHILNIYEIGDQKTAQFLKENDSVDDDREDEGYKTYEHLPIVVEPDSDDDDDEPDLTLYADSYSENDYASTSQLFMYFYEYVNSGSASSLKSSCKTAISEIFDGIISNYTSDSFKEWRMIKQMNITFAGDTDNTKINWYVSNLEKDLVGYDYTEFTLYTDWIDSEKFDWTIDFTK